MRRLGPELCCSIGIAALVGGLCALAYGLLHTGTTVVAGSPWEAENYCFLGGILAAAGSGLATFGLLVLRGRRAQAKPERDELA
jgi:hypothetical protein